MVNKNSVLLNFVLLLLYYPKYFTYYTLHKRLDLINNVTNMIIPASYGVREGALRRKYMLLKKYILFQKTYILFQKTYILFQKTYILFQKTYILFQKTYILFQKTYVFWNVYICGKTYIFRKAPSRTWRVPCTRRGLTKNICFSANINVPKNICFLKKYICFLEKYICFLKKYIFF